MKENKRLWRILIPIVFLFSLAGLVYTMGCIAHEDAPRETTPTTENSTSPANTPDSTDQETEAPPEEIGDPYELVFSSNGDGTCKVSDIKVNPKYREAFTLTIPAVSPEGERVTAVENPNGFGYINVPRVLLPEDFEVLLYRIRTYYGKDSMTARSFESYYYYKNVDDCSTENLKNDLLDAFPWAAVTDFYILDGTIVADVEIPKLALWIAEAAPDYTALEGEKRMQELVSGNGMTLTWDGKPVGTETVTDNALFVQSIVLEEGIGTIGANAFCHARAASLTLPATLTEIGDRAFAYCREITEMTWPQNTLRRIGDEAFAGCYGLTELNLTGDGLTIGARAFSPSALKSVTLGEGVTEVGANAFENQSLERLHIGDDVTILGTYAFATYSPLKVVFGENSRLSRIEDGALNRPLVDTTLPHGITYIGEQGLYGDEVSYAGTVAEWEAIEKHTAWSSTDITVHCTDGDVSFDPKG
ncbi:MAG: leucine-rich repeat protein [Clostridia bacterium]|nr:leucine-rich repeat protein [Clostridia bacterium]